MADDKKKEDLYLDEKDRKILSLLENYPEMTQTKMAEYLNISQPSIGHRIYNLKKKGAYAHTIGINLKKVNLYKNSLSCYMAIVDITTKDPMNIMEIFKNCPYFLNGFIISGRHNLCLLFVGENISTLEAIVNGHLRDNSSIGDIEFNIVISYAKDLILPLKLNLDQDGKPPCGIKHDCKFCGYYKSDRCLGCPATKNYRGKIWEK